MNCLKNKILNIISVIAVMIMWFIGAGLDGFESLILPIVVFLLCALWLILMYCANKERSEDIW